MMRQFVLRMFLFFICLIGFGLIAQKVFYREVMPIDIRALEFTKKYLVVDFLTPIIKFITQFGGFYVLGALTLAIIIFVKNIVIRVSVAYNMVAITLFNLTFKTFFARPRPEVALIDVDDFSFPSGHAMISTVFYGFLIYLILLKVKNVKLKWGLTIFLGILIVLISFSRIYLGVHYLSDVVAGLLFSIAYLAMCVSMVDFFIGVYDEFN